MIQARGLPRRERKRLVALVRKESDCYPSYPVMIPREDWPEAALRVDPLPRQVWRSNRFLIQIYESRGHSRITVCCTSLKVSGEYEDHISWEDLQRIKGEVGFRGCWAVECFPPESDVVNVANMRHLWVIDEPPYGWKAAQ